MQTSRGQMSSVSGVPRVPELQRLRDDHGPSLLAFELANRAYFATWVPDRGDDYFADFDARLRDRLAEQAAGVCQFHVLVEHDGAVVGRINVIDVADGSAELGYRIAESVAGRGVATAAVREMCTRAAREYGLATLHAKTTLDNLGSLAVLARAGFEPAGEIELNGRPGRRFIRDLR